MSTCTFEQLLRWGNPEGMLWKLQELPEEQRVAMLKPLRGTAKKILESETASYSDDWDGPLSSGHDRAAAIVRYPRAEDVARRVPEVQEFIEWDVPALFPKDLSMILASWGELFLKNPKHYDRVGNMLTAISWLKYNSLRIPFTQGVTLLLLTGGVLGGVGASRLYDVLAGKDELAFSLVKAAFRIPGVKGASLEQADGGYFGENSIGGFLIPTLIYTGIITQSEVLTWCDGALIMPERSNYDKQWFRRLKKYLTSTAIPAISEPSERYWLSPRERLISVALDMQAGIAHPEIEHNSAAMRLLPLMLFLQHTDFGGLEIGLTTTHIDENPHSLHEADGHNIVEQACSELERLGLSEVAALVADCDAHWHKYREKHLERDLPYPDEAAEYDNELDRMWYDVSDSVEQAVAAALAQLGDQPS